MSKFAKALQQAEHDAALGKNGSGPRPASVEARPAPGAAPPPPPSDMEPLEEHLVSLISPAAFEAEQYRALRHIVEQMRKAANIQVVAVSSPAVGDGKTTTAINLAGALAQSPEVRVLLVDADIRRPSLGHLFGLAESSPGLVEAILDPALTLDEIVLPRPQFNLSLLHAGRALTNSPYEILRSARLGELVEAARRQFDYVVVDTPPLATVQDCRLIARWVDGFLVVVAAHRTPRRLVEEALRVVESAKMLGLIFNADDSHRRTSYYGYTGGYFESRPSSSPGRSAGARIGIPKWTWRKRGEAR